MAGVVGKPSTSTKRSHAVVKICDAPYVKGEFSPIVSTVTVRVLISSIETPIRDVQQS